MRTRLKLSALVAGGCLALMVGACAKDPAIVKQRHLEKAQAYYAKSQYNEAIVELKNAIQVDPKFTPAVHLIGRAYAAKAWHLDAARELRRTVELEPDNLEARIDLGRAYVAIEAWDGALQEAAAIAGKDPANTWGLYFQAAALNAKGQRQDAMAAIDKARAGGQASPEFHTLRGDILNGLQRFGEAESAYRAALAHAAGLTDRMHVSGRRRHGRVRPRSGRGRVRGRPRCSPRVDANRGSSIGRPADPHPAP